MLLTFTRRTAETMTRRAEQIAAQVANGSASARGWGRWGTRGAGGPAEGPRGTGLENRWAQARTGSSPVPSAYRRATSYYAYSTKQYNPKGH